MCSIYPCPCGHGTWEHYKHLRVWGNRPTHIRRMAIFLLVCIFRSGALCILCHPKRPYHQYLHLYFLFPYTEPTFRSSPRIKVGLCLWPCPHSSHVNQQRCLLKFCSLKQCPFISAFQGHFLVGLCCCHRPLPLVPAYYVD